MKRLTLLLILPFVLSACVNGDRYDLAGSSKNWDVFYTVEVSGGDKQQTTGTIKYTGDGVAPETIDYEIGYILSKESGRNVEVKSDTANISDGSCEGCAVIQEDTEIEAVINWDGQTENVILTSEK